MCGTMTFRKPYTIFDRIIKEVLRAQSASIPVARS